MLDEGLVLDYVLLNSLSLLRSIFNVSVSALSVEYSIVRKMLLSNLFSSCDLGSSWCISRKDWLEPTVNASQAPLGPICALMGPLEPSYAVDPQFR